MKFTYRRREKRSKQWSKEKEFLPARILWTNCQRGELAIKIRGSGLNLYFLVVELGASHPDVVYSVGTEVSFCAWPFEDTKSHGKSGSAWSKKDFLPIHMLWPRNKYCVFSLEIPVPACWDTRNNIVLKRCTDMLNLSFWSSCRISNVGGVNLDASTPNDIYWEDANKLKWKFDLWTALNWI